LLIYQSFCGDASLEASTPELKAFIGHASGACPKGVLVVEAVQIARHGLELKPARRDRLFVLVGIQNLLQLLGGPITALCERTELWTDRRTTFIRDTVTGRTDLLGNLLALLGL
jgi:hypothetical protein